jgi:hypothetical protein
VAAWRRSLLALFFSGLPGGCAGPPTHAASAALPTSASAPPFASASASASAPPLASASASASASAAAPPLASGAPASVAGGSVLIGDIVTPKHFDPKPTLESLSLDLVGCFQQARARNHLLHGKLKLRVVVNEAGAVQRVQGEPGGSANDPTLVACIADAMKEATFPKPGGMATIVVPLVFRR